METFGERLRREREAHRATIEQVSAATGILLTYLEALERNDFSSLPGRAFGKLYIRAYAETLGFDPQRLIDEYDREQEQERPVALKPPASDPAPPRRVEAVIERWRRTARAERARPTDPGESVEIGTGGIVDAPPPDGNGEAMGAAPGDLPQAPPHAPNDMRRREAADGAPRANAVIDVPALDARASAPIRASRLVVTAALAMGLCAGAVWALFALLYTGPEPDEAPPVASLREVPGPDPTRVEPVRDSVIPSVAPRASRATPKAAVEPSEPSDLTILDHGVGPRIAGHELVDRVGRFAQWDVARFWTRVIGGEPGDVIRHVWLREGRVVQSIELELGGDDWRTHSRKTLGQPGEWAVEARDLDGRVLARATFTCSATRR